jgi:hypothetical protein
MWLHSIKNLFLKFNTIIFIVFIVGILAFCVVSINQTLGQTTGSGIADGEIDPNQTSFDSSTKSKLSILKSSSENQNGSQLPSGRINPFWDFTE